MYMYSTGPEQGIATQADAPARQSPLATIGDVALLISLSLLSESLLFLPNVT